MGTTIDAWIEYDELGDPPFSEQPEAIPLDVWYDLRSAKDYRVYAALSGARNGTGIQPLYPLRGLPINPSWQAAECLGKNNTLASWLHPSEVFQALGHHHVSENEISLEMRCVLQILRFLESQIEDRRVRFVFEIE